MSESDGETSPVDDTEEFISQARQSLLEKESFTPPNDRQIDIHQNVKEIRAILKTNEEIFDRCMKSSKDPVKARLTPTTFTRTEFNHVHASNEKVIGGSANLTEKTVFRIYPEQTEKGFDLSVLVTLPRELGTIYILRPPRKDTGFIDYEAFFKSSFVLRDDVLAPFLFHLKEHLMSVQVCLGEIDAWLMEYVNSETIKKIFGEADSLELQSTQTPPVLKMKLCKCHVGRHDPSDICGECKFPFSRHKSELRTCNFKCPRLRNSMSTYFHCKQAEPYVIKECPSPGKHQVKFNISKEDERVKLTKFMDYISS